MKNIYLILSIAMLTGNTVKAQVTVTGSTGANATYATLTDASAVTGAFAAINAAGTQAGKTIIITIDASIVEPGLTALLSGDWVSLTIKPGAPATVISGLFDNGPLVKIKSSNVIIDGSFNGTASRDLTISNTSIANSYVLHIGSTGIVPVTNTTVKNCIVINGTTVQGFAIVVSDEAGPNTPGYFNDIALTNNSIQKTSWGIYCNAVAVTGNGNGLAITANNLDNTGINEIKSIGIYTAGVDGCNISGNVIGNFDLISPGTKCGIWLNTGTSNAVIEKNIIHDIGYIGGVGFGGQGIIISTGLANANVMVKNNMIYGMTGDGDSYASYGAEFDPVGIYARGTGQGGIHIYYNSIYLSGSTLNFSADAHSIGIALNDDTEASVKNNIILNELGVLTLGFGAVGIAAQTSASQFSALDHNNYYCNVPLGANLVGKIGLIDYPSLAAWQTATGKEANSLNVEPNFVSATDLHLAATNNCSFDGAGTPVAGITTDYDDQPRDVNTPDMGADEFTATYSVTLAGITGSAVCENKIVSPAGTTFASGICDLIARVEPSGGSAVTGKINVCVTLDAATQYFNGEPYVQRHHDIEPAVSPAAATATITLYYTDQDFIDYNANNIVWPDLPTGALGNADPNRANVRVTQFHGAATTSPSSPGNYPDTSLLITPGVPNVFWNGTFWEVTFPVTGFSGFYLHTTFTEAPLPVIVNYLNGRRQSGKHLLDWKVTCVSTTVVTMTLERSVDARNYSGIYTITADAARCNQPFDHTDAQPLPGMNYYRLKMVDANGKITYSTTIALLNANKGFEIISIAPNPVTTGNFKLNVTSATAVTMQVIITDMQGRTVSRQSIPVVAGFSIIPMHAGNLAAGTYTIQGIMAGERSKMIRFIKQ